MLAGFWPWASFSFVTLILFICSKPIHNLHIFKYRKIQIYIGSTWTIHFHLYEEMDIFANATLFTACVQICSCCMLNDQLINFSYPLPLHTTYALYKTWFSTFFCGSIATASLTNSQKIHWFDILLLNITNRLKSLFITFRAYINL